MISTTDFLKAAEWAGIAHSRVRCPDGDRLYFPMGHPLSVSRTHRIHRCRRWGVVRSGTGALHPDGDSGSRALPHRV